MALNPVWVSILCGVVTCTNSQAQHVPSPCETKHGGLCVYSNMCKGTTVNVDSATLCAKEEFQMPGESVVCCKRDGAVRGCGSKESGTEGSICMPWCGLTVRSLGSDCLGGLPMCCRLV